MLRRHREHCTPLTVLQAESLKEVCLAWGVLSPLMKERPAAGGDGAETQALTSDLPFGVVQPQAGP